MAMGEMHLSSSSQLRRLAVVTICVSPVLRYYLSLHHFEYLFELLLPVDSLMARTLLAILVHSPAYNPWKFTKPAWACLLVAVPLAFVANALNALWAVLSLTAIGAAGFIYLSLCSTAKIGYRPL